MQKLWKSCQTQLLSGEKGEGPQTLFAVSKNPERILGTVHKRQVRGWRLEAGEADLQSQSAGG